MLTSMWAFLLSQFVSFYFLTYPKQQG